MKKLLLFLLIQASFATLAQNDDYFEGEVWYNIDYHVVNSSYSIKRLRDVFGVKSHLIFKNGSFVKYVYDRNGKLLNTTYLDLKENKSYYIRNGESTVMWYDIRESSSTVRFEYLKDSTILKHRVIIYNEYISMLLQDTKDTIRNVTKLYSAPSIKINPEWYKNYKATSYDKMVKLAKGLMLKYDMDFGNYIRMSTAVKIIKRKVSDDEIKFVKKEAYTYKKV